MTTNRYDENLILGYIENTLSDQEKQAFETHLKIDPQLTSLVDMMRQDKQMLHELDQVTAPMELGDYISNQLQRQVLLGPLPHRHKLNPNHRTTPRSRSQFRIMRLGAYGALAAMFLLVAGLMYYYIGDQSLIHRTQQFAFEPKTQNGPVMAMNQPSPQANGLEQHDKPVTSAAAKSLSEMSFQSKSDTLLPTPKQMANHIGSREEVQMDLAASPTTRRGSELKRLSPTTAKLAQAPSIPNRSGKITSKKMAHSAGLKQQKTEALQQPPTLAWADDSKTSLRTIQEKSPPTPMAMTVHPAQKQQATAQQSRALAKEKIAQPPSMLCLIQSPRQNQTIQDIEQWALRNRVRILMPKVQQSKSTNKKQSEPKQLSSKQTRPVITLNIPASQLPVLIQWLNQQPQQQNHWIQSQPKTHWAQSMLKRLQQKLPLIPTIPLVEPQQIIQVQLVIISQPQSTKDQD